MSDQDYTTVFPAENIRVEVDGLRRHLNLYLLAVGGGFKKLLTKQARLMCRDMLDYTLPVEGGSMGPGKGTTRGALKHGEEVVEGQIAHLFRPLSGAKYGDVARNNDFGVFAAFVTDRKRENLPLPHFLDNTIGIGEWERFKTSFGDDDQMPMMGGRGANFEYANAGESQIESVHKARRGGPANYDTRSTMGDEYFISDYNNKIPRYIRSVQKRVGRLKAGWYSTSVLLGDKSWAPAWFEQNQWGTGCLYDELSNKTQPALTIENKKHGRMSKDPGFKGFESALSRRSYAIRNDIIQVMTSRGQTLQLLELARRAENADLFLVTEAPF
jgi:hypothetical protein